MSPEAMQAESLRIVPVTLAQAQRFVAERHRHHEPSVGHRFSVGLARGGALVGVAMVGRPVARELDAERLVEVTRLCTDGTPNACSMLYGACARAAEAMGFFAIITYTLASEPGTSLKAAGWWGVVLRERGAWDTPSRRRGTPHLGAKVRWVRVLREWPEWVPEDEDEEPAVAQGVLL